MQTRQPLVEMLGTLNSVPEYSDGAAEDQLLELFSREDDRIIQAEIIRLLEENPSWPLRVHLSPQRHHLLAWYPFRSNASLLEIGAGCGALTGLLCERVGSVDALELSLKRADILRRRHRHQANLRVLAGDVQTLSTRQTRYDYIVAVGVLEYAGRYVQTLQGSHAFEPYRGFLRNIAGMLKSDGILLLAIENQLGSKYLVGSAEDHYAQPLVGVEDYLQGSGVRTFGRAELKSLLEQSGLKVIQYYYPFPDYKFPSVIYSDELPPGSLDPISLLYPTIDLAYPRQPLFDEGRFMNVIARNGMALNFANSFLVECQQ